MIFKKILYVILLIFISYSIFSVEGKTIGNKDNILKGSSMIKSNTAFYFPNNSIDNKLKFYSTGKKNINKNIKIGIICLALGGANFFVLFPIFTGVGVYLITYTEMQNVHYWSYGSEVYGTEAYQPYETAGIVMASFGGIFLLASIPLFIVGGINLYRGIKKRKAQRFQDDILTRLSWNMNYNPYNEEINLSVKYLL